MDYSHKKGVIYSELMLPERAPPEFADRAALWNSVEKAEKQWNSQLARRIIMALPKELSHEDNIRLVRQYCQEQFVNKGMCCDFAIHDEGDGNPHAHILLTLRGLDERGKWLPKARKVYDLDEKGQRIRLPSGNWRSHKEDTVDWNDQKYCEIWRHEWETLQNRYLESAGREERVDLRSFQRQGSDFAPTVHMGAAITHMERKGIHTDIGDLNREIRSFNRVLQSIKDRIRSLLEKIANLTERSQQPTTLIDLLQRYCAARDGERQQWQASSLTKLKASTKDFERVQQAIQLLERSGLTDIEDFKAHLHRLSQSAADLKHNYDLRTKQINRLNRIVVYFKHKELLDNVQRKYQRIHFKGARERYYQKNKKMLDCYAQAQKAMREYRISDAASAQFEQNRLRQENAVTEEKLNKISGMLKEYKAILKMANAALPDDAEKIIYTPGRRQTGAEILPEPEFRKPQKASIRQRLKDHAKEDMQRSENQREMDVQKKHNHDQTL